MVARIVLVLIGILFIAVGVFAFPPSPPAGLVSIGAGAIIAGFGGTLSFTNPAAKVSGGAGFVLIIVGALMMWIPHP